MDFSTIVQSPEIRAIVQDGTLERGFHDGLFPRILFRGEAAPVEFPANVGDSMVFTGVGLMEPNTEPLVPGNDPIPGNFQLEQWAAQLHTYAGAAPDTAMPTSITAIASLLYRNAQQCGLQAAQTVNRIVRNRLYNAALSGWTVADGTVAQSGTTLRVKRLNGLTTARRPDLPNGSPVRFDTVSANNPLKIKLFDNGAEVDNTITGFASDTPGDEIGPGTVTLGTAATSVANRAYVMSEDRTGIVRVGGGNKVDAVTGVDVFTLAAIRAAVSRMQNQNVPEMPDMRFHAHLDPISHSQIFSDYEAQRLFTALPDSYYIRNFAIGEMQGCIFLRNSECPQFDKVIGGPTATFSQKDNFAGELYNTGVPSGVKIHRPLFLGQESVYEYYQDLAALITEAGVNGKVGSWSISNNGIEINSDRIQMIIRAPQNRLQDMVATAWRLIADWPVRTDATTGDAARFKRVVCVEHGS